MNTQGDVEKRVSIEEHCIGVDVDGIDADGVDCDGCVMSLSQPSGAGGEDTEIPKQDQQTPQGYIQH